MSTSQVDSPRKGFSEVADEEQLPLYEEFQATEPSELDAPPDATATPDQVREWITHLLITKRGLSEDHVRRIAARWTIGRGEELCQYPPAMYFDIFGREDGWIVYKEVKTCVYNVKYQKPHGARSNRSKDGCSVGVVIAWCIEFALIGVFLFSVMSTGGHYILAGFSTVGWILFGAFTVAITAGEKKPEDRAAEELQEAMKSSTTPDT